MHMIDTPNGQSGATVTMNVVARTGTLALAWLISWMPLAAQLYAARLIMQDCGGETALRATLHYLC